LESDTLFEPRIRMRVPVPVVPPLLSTCTPGARPEIKLVNSVIGDSLATACTSMVDTAFAISSLRCSPVAVVTISSSWTGAGVMAKSAVAVSPSASVTLCTAGR
jgi:hypothetical protein